MKKSIIFTTLLCLTINWVACTTMKDNPKTTKGSVIGGITGILTGIITKQRPEKTIALGAAGALAGGTIGYMMDQQEKN
ncbi:MAG: hypothetical protein OMM_06360 [Candidatus Magnetoglobus multicellularis str. Araruama]|uniref:Glycine zipper domain-containing protein n=1 Tax=Candidatus Magnetoglobus multicellularis str. Araruama TaxID=890399 RepID=A0A1V1PI15_9BACT|nr:MAG: hypothetical protein OMM_06360 [Candidatus Magnetoglobus multicellularis str. Araruama]